MTLSTIFDGDVKIEENPNGHSFTGKVESRYTLINYKPVEEMTVSFAIKDNTLFIQSFSLGEVKGQGMVGLRRPFPTEFAVQLDNVAMEDFLWFWNGGNSIPSSGFVSGKIGGAGSADRLALTGQLSTYNGQVQDLAYDTILVNLEGVYPIVNLYNSSVTEASGFTFTIDGSLNLEDHENFPKQLAALSKAPLVNEDS